MRHDALRTRPLLDRDGDERLFVEPEGFGRCEWNVIEGFNLLVTGPRGIGKTTSLRQLQLRLRRAQPERNIAFVDLGSAASVDDALRDLAIVTASFQEQLQHQPLRLPLESDAERTVRMALELLAGAAPFTFFIDNISTDTVAPAMFGALRDRLWETPHQWVVSVESSERRAFLAPPSDAFWDEIVELSYTKASLRSLIRLRLEDSAFWLDALLDNASATPRQLLRAAAAASRSDQEAAGVLAELQDWQQRVGRLERRPAMLVAELSNRPPVSASDPDLLHSLGWARTTLLRVLDELEQAGLVESWSQPNGTGRPKRLFSTTEPGRPRRA